jgi:hypothetical protein
MQEDAATSAVLFGQKGRHETQHFTRGVRSSRISLEPEGLPLEDQAPDRTAIARLS